MQTVVHQMKFYAGFFINSAKNLCMEESQMSDFKLKQIEIYVSSILKECQMLETYYNHRKEKRIVEELQAQIRVLKQVQNFVSSLL